MFQPRALENPEDGAMGEWRSRWTVVLAAAIGYGTGGAMMILLGGLFIKPMREDLGWSTASVTFMPMVSLVWALCNPFAGAAIDRFGSRPVAIVGMLGMALCAAMLGALPVTPVGLFGVAGVMGLFASMTSVATYSRGVASWFSRSLGFALGLALSGSAAVAILATPLVGTTIALYGWRAGFLVLAALILFIALPAIVLLYRERAALPGAGTADVQAEGARLGEVIRSARFWCYACSFTLACIAISGTATHLQPLLAEKSVPLYKALFLGVVFAIAISVGKVVGGLLLDRLWPFAVASGISLVAGAGAFGLASVDAATAFPGTVLIVGAIGVAAGAEADFVAFFGLRSFGMRKFSTIVGILAMIVTLGNALGGWLYGYLFDRFGNYEVACLVGATCLLASAMFVLFAGIGESRDMASVRKS